MITNRGQSFKIGDKIEVRTNKRRKDKMKTGIELRGDVILERRRDGQVIEREELKNLVVNAGKIEVAKLLTAGEASDAFAYIAIGTGSTAPDAGDTTLETEEEREEADNSGGQYEADYKCIFEKTFTFGSGVSYSITEAGVFNDAGAGDMLDRFTFSAKAVDSDTDLYIKVTITVS